MKTLLASLGVAALALVARDASAQQVVNYGVQPATMPIYIARELGLLDPIEKKHNVKIVFRNFAYGAPENQAMAAGELQIASAGMGPAIIAASRLPSTLVAITILEQTAIIVPKDSPLRSVKELKGKKVAFPGEGSQQYPLLLKALADAGLKQSDITLFKTDGAQIPTLLQNKSVDAGITWDPHVSNALAAGHSKVLVKAVDFILKDPKGAARMWAKQIGFPENVINYSLAEGISVYSRNVVPEKMTIDAYAKFLKDAKILKEDDNPKFNASFAQKALAEAGKGR